jgi:hypothetical protein
MAAREDPKFSDVLENNLSEEDMLIVSFWYEYISSHILSDKDVAALEAEVMFYRRACECLRNLCKRNKALKNLSILDSC